jgi:hypothetical protein
MTKTAVEFIEDYLKFKGIIIDDKTIPQVLVGVINQAKEMERQQIIESYCQGCFDISLNKNIFPRETSEQYYKETFKK